jgi:tRNA G18 (ribose-2'-O)-methylase SpoU
VRALRRQLAGIDTIAAAIHAGEPVRVLLVQHGDPSVAVLELAALAQSRGVRVWQGSEGDLRRMSRGAAPERAMAMLGPPVEADLTSLFARGGAVWLLHRAAYPSNVGFAIRTAEVSGADGVVVDGSFNHEERSRISHVSMGADRLLPVLWESTERTLTAARASGHRVIAIEDGGSSAPWEHDLTAAVVLLVGNERHGIAPELLARCDAIATIPMTGFVPSYNLQAAISAVAAERLRQLAHGAPPERGVTR